jgi:hypothetical protein
VGILLPIAEMLLAEHERRPITGDLVTIGRQSVYLFPTDLVQLLVLRGHKLMADAEVELDEETSTGGMGYITDRSFFASFCDAKLRSVDVSDYEGASDIVDLNKPLPDHMAGIADFLFDGSCLDNVFNPAAAIFAMSKMLRPGGRMFCFNHSTPIQSAFVCLSPEWFLEYFQAAGYEDIRIHVCEFENVLDRFWGIHRWAWGDETPYPPRDFIVVAMAEKTAASVDEVCPIQAHYRCDG